MSSRITYSSNGTYLYNETNDFDFDFDSNSDFKNSAGIIMDRLKNNKLTTNLLKFSTYNGIHSSSDIVNEDQFLRFDRLTNLLSFCIDEASLKINENFSIYIYPDGSIKFIADKFIESGQLLLMMDLDKISFDAMKLFRLVIPNSDDKVKSLNERIDKFKEFYQKENKDENRFYALHEYCKALPFIIAIFAAQKKVKSVDYKYLPRLLKSFHHFWDSLPNGGYNFQPSVIINFTSTDWKIIKDSSNYSYFNDLKEVGLEVFNQLLLPFIQSIDNNDKMFEIDKIDKYSFFDIYAIISSLPGSTEVHPLVGLIGLKIETQANVKIKEFKVSEEDKDNNNSNSLKLKGLISSNGAIEAADEICFGDKSINICCYYMKLLKIPVEKEMILYNYTNSIFLKFYDFFYEQLQIRHPTNSDLIEKKMKHMCYNIENCKNIQITLRDVTYFETTDSIYLIQEMIIFITMDEVTSLKSIENNRRDVTIAINENEILKLITILIDKSIGDFPMDYIRELLSLMKRKSEIESRELRRMNELTRNAIFLKFSERSIGDLLTAKLTSSIINDETRDYYLAQRSKVAFIDSILNILEDEEFRYRYENCCCYCGRTDVSCKICSRCNVKTYCSSDCQKNHFIHHKSFCKQISKKKK